MAPHSNLRYGIACLIAGLLFIATACEAEQAAPAPATPGPAPEATSSPAPAPPTPTAVPVGEVREVRLSSPARGMLRISWTHTDPAPTDYQVSWAKLNEDFPPPSDDVGNAYPTVASHVVTGLDAGTMYKARIRARHWDGSDGDSIRNGPWSATEAVRVIAPPFAPTGLTAVATHRGVILEWDDPGDDTVASYEVVRAFKDRFGGSHVVHTGSAETQYLDTDVLPDLGYVYTLHAVNSFGKGQVSEAVTVTTLARIPGRDYLYEPISPPVHAAAIWWYWDARQRTIREMTVDFTIHNNVDDWSRHNGYYLMLLHGRISDISFYVGLQTAISHAGAPRVKGAIYSRWDTRDLANARAAADGWTQSAGYEGDFIGVRRPYDWGAGSYRAGIAPDGLDPEGEWYSAWITNLDSGETLWVGSLRFPHAGGAAYIDDVSYSTLELYGSPTRPIDTPELYVTMSAPLADGVQPAQVLTDYPYDAKPGSAMRNSDSWFDSVGSTAHLRIGGTTERVHAEQWHTIE